MGERVTLGEFRAVLERHKLNSDRVLRTVAMRLAATIQQEAVRNVNDDLLMKRTGGLMRYIGAKLAERREGPRTVMIGLPKGEPLAVIGRVQDEGQTIHPKNSTMLRIPLPPALTGAGVLKAPLGEAGFSIRGEMAPGTDKKFFLLPGHNLVGINRGDIGVKGGHFEAWFSLHPFVVLKPRGWFRGAVQYARQRLDIEVRQAMTKFLQARGEVDENAV